MTTVVRRGAAGFWQTYGKAIVPALGTIASGVQAYTGDGVVTGNEWAKISIFALATILTVFAPARTNQPPLRPGSRGDLRDRT